MKQEIEFKNDGTVSYNMDIDDDRARDIFIFAVDEARKWSEGKNGVSDSFSELIKYAENQSELCFLIYTYSSRKLLFDANIMIDFDDIDKSTLRDD